MPAKNNFGKGLAFGLVIGVVVGGLGGAFLSNFLPEGGLAGPKQAQASNAKRNATPRQDGQEGITPPADPAPPEINQTGTDPKPQDGATPEAPKPGDAPGTPSEPPKVPDPAGNPAPVADPSKQTDPK